MLSREAIQDQAHLLALRPDLELRLQDLEVVLDRLLACWIEIEGVEGLLVDLRAQLVHLRAVQGGVGLDGRGRRRGPAAAAHREIAGFRRDPSGIGGAAPKIATVAAVYRRILTISLDLTMLGQDGQEPGCSATAGYKA